jgi:hypothetical protein
LVSTEGVFIDPVRLIIKTKQQTETSKKLETKLEDLFSSSSLREMKGKKNKASNRVARSKKTEAKRYEAKKLQRIRLEKELTANMESYVTRSVNDSDLDFFPPEYPNDDINWPISIKWPQRADVKTQSMEHVEGEMNPELLLLYALERISIPAGEHTLQKVFKNLSIQLYFIYMFWLVKVKFFLNDKEVNAESFLLKKLSSEYVKIVELLSKKAHGGNNKDFVFQYLPFIISNAVYYSFYFLCPGSRHMYSKGFRKTILMQVVQVMHGIQLCPVSVRVAWAKLFPEEEQDDLTHDGEENDMIPMMIPLTHTKRSAAETATDDFSRAVSPDGSGIRPGSTPMRKGPLMEDVDELLKSTTGDEANDQNKTSKDKLRLSASAEAMFGKSDQVLESTYNTTSMGAKVINPVERLSLRPPPTKSKFIVPRQRRERTDVNDISPLMQQYLAQPTAGGFKRAQTLARTVPVNWCVAGGSDTHRRRQIPKELHDELSNKSRSLQKDCRRITSNSHFRKVADGRNLDRMCTTLIGAGNGAVGRYSQDLVRKLKNCRGLADIESNDDATVQSLVHVEDEDIFNDNSTLDF